MPLQLIPTAATVSLNGVVQGQVDAVMRNESGVPVVALDLASVVPGDKVKPGDVVTLTWAYTVTEVSG
jgi:hypothetical protein